MPTTVVGGAEDGDDGASPLDADAGDVGRAWPPALHVEGVMQRLPDRGPGRVTGGGEGPGGT